MDNKDAAEHFVKYLKLSTPPVALKMCTSKNELSQEALIPSKEWGVDLRVCQATQVAREYEVTVAVPKYEMPCPTGAVALGFYEPNELYWSGSCLSPSFMSQEAKKAIARNTPKLDAGTYEYMIVAPMDKASFEPDLVLFYGNPGQITKLIQARVLNSGNPLTASTMCGTACSEWLSKAMITRECQYVFPCDGERKYGTLENSEMIFSLPYEKMEEVLEGLEAACNAKERRYPAQKFLIHQGPNSERYETLLKSLRKNAGL